jgi:hypothetical protein
LTAEIHSRLCQRPERAEAVVTAMSSVHERTAGLHLSVSGADKLSLSRSITGRIALHQAEKIPVVGRVVESQRAPFCHLPQ